MSQRHKNLVIVTFDELRADATGFMGNPDCQTPNLDAFAERAVVAANHFTVHGKCVPSRIAMATGRYSHTDGFRTIFQHLPPDQPSILPLLRKHGYETAIFGLNHVWETLFDCHEPYKAYADFHSFTDGKLHELALREVTYPEPGPEARPEPDYDVPFACGRRLTGKHDGFLDCNRTEQAIYYLRELRNRDKPFYMQLNLSKPHPAYEAPEPWYSMYDPSKVTPWPHDLPENAPLPLRVMREIRAGGHPPEAALREIQATYYAMISQNDQLFGKVMAELEQQNLLENTIVIFTADHGDFAGQYGLHEKWDTCMSDCILHVPFILYDPDLPRGERMNHLSSHVDVLPTILELLGIQADWGIHGKSMLPRIHGNDDTQAVFADGGHEQEMWARFNFDIPEANPQAKPRPCDGKQRTYKECPETMARTKMVRTKDWKLVQRLVGGNELYDLKNDPHELHNLWRDDETDATRLRIINQLQRLMIEWCLETDTDRPFQPRVGA